MVRYLEIPDAMRVVFEYGFELKDESFVELTPEQYAALAENGSDVSGRWFRVSRGLFEERNNPPSELPIVNEGEKARILQAVDLVIRMSDKADRTFRDFRERLAYLKDRLPGAVTGHPDPKPQRSDATRQTGAAHQEDGKPRQPVALEPPDPPRYPSLEMAARFQDEGKVEEARDLILNFLRWQSSADAILEAIRVLSRRATPRTLHYLEHVYQEEADFYDTAAGRIRRYLYPQAPEALAERLRHEIPLPRPAAPAEVGDAVPGGAAVAEIETRHEEFVQRSPEHQLLHTAIAKTRHTLEEAAAAAGRSGFESLFDVVPPPEYPVDARPADDDGWNEVEFRLGLQLPQDYKKLIEIYGSGAWGSVINTLNPFSSDPELNLERRVHAILRSDHMCRRRVPGDVPFPLYPERDGLLPWGYTTTLRMYWLTEENLEPDAWQILVLERQGFLFDRFQPPTSDFLVRFVTGELKSNLIGQLLAQYRGKFFPASEHPTPTESV